MSAQTIFISNSGEFMNAENEFIVKKFKKLIAQYFVAPGSHKGSLSDVIKARNQFYQFSLPSSISEQFISLEEAPVFWLYESPINKFLTGKIRSLNPSSNDSASIKSIKDHYTRWILMKSEDEKKYYASATIRLIEKLGEKYYFYTSLLYGTILCFDKYIFSPSKAKKMFDLVEEKMSLLSPDEFYKSEIIYLVKLFKAFVAIKEENYEEAGKIIEESMKVNPYGVSAKFYHFFLGILADPGADATPVVQEIYNFDLKRLKYAIDEGNIPLYNYFVINNVTQNLAFFEGASQTFNPLRLIIDEAELNGRRMLDELITKLNKFSYYKKNEYVTPVIIEIQAFIEKLIKIYAGGNSILFLDSIPALNGKFSQALDLILKNIRDKYTEEAKKDLEHYVNDISNHKKKKGDVEVEETQVLKKVEEENNGIFESVKKKLDDEIDIMENRANNLHLEADLDPMASFKNTMTYSFLITLLVAILGGFAGYSNDFSSAADFSSSITTIMITGIKWGAVTLILGVVMSVIIAGSVFLERSKRKQMLVQKISEKKLPVKRNWRKQKSRMLKNLKK